METIKSMLKQAEEAGYENILDLCFYCAECGNTDLYKEFKTYTSRLLMKLLDDCFLHKGEYNEYVLYKVYAALTRVIADRLRVKTW